MPNETTTLAESLTFGIEIETTLPSASRTVVGGYHRPTQVEWLPEGWKVGSDCSIDASRGRKGAEFVSPVLKGKEGVQQVIDVVKLLNDKKARVNSSCGLHIHIGFDKRNRKEMKKLTTMVANFEKAIYAQTGTKKREAGRWCNSLQRRGNVHQAMSAQRSTRYVLLNTQGRFPTVEFRAFAATLNVEKVIGHLLTCIGLVEKSLEAKRITKFTAKTPVQSSPIARSGEGQTAVTRLFYALGWTKGREKKVFADLWDGISVDIKAVKKELMRLAKKYDTI